MPLVRKIVTNSRYDMSRESKVKMYRVCQGTGPEEGSLAAGSATAGPLAARVAGDGAGGFRPGAEHAGIVVVIQSREPAGETVDRRLSLGVLIHEIAQSPGEPADRDLLLAAPVVELLDATVGEVHRGQPACGSAASRIAACSAACALPEPDAGAELAGRETSVTLRFTTAGRCSAMYGQPPMLAGSSCTQVISAS